MNSPIRQLREALKPFTDNSAGGKYRTRPEDFDNARAAYEATAGAHEGVVWHQRSVDAEEMLHDLIRCYFYERAEGLLELMRKAQRVLEGVERPAAHEPGDGLPHYTCPNCGARDEFSVRHDTVEDRGHGEFYPVVPVVKCEACGQEVRAELRGGESRIDLPPDDGRAGQRPADLAAGIQWLKGEIRDGDAYLFDYPDSAPELEQQAARRNLLTALAAVSPQRSAEYTQGSEPLHAAPRLSQGDAEDARRWRALIGCARVRVLGSAGIYRPNAQGHAHIGVEFWTRHETPSDPSALEDLINFTTLAARAHPSKSTGAV